MSRISEKLPKIGIKMMLECCGKLQIKVLCFRYDFLYLLKKWKKSNFESCPHATQEQKCLQEEYIDIRVNTFDMIYWHWTQNNIQPVPAKNVLILPNIRNLPPSLNFLTKKNFKGLDKIVYTTHIVNIYVNMGAN